MTTLPTERGLTRIWRSRAVHVESPPAPTTLAGRVLAARGLTDPAACTAFLEPSLLELHDPSLIPDLDRAAARLLEALRAREPVVIYGDYDVDGVSATAILFHMMRALAPGADVRSYIPHRVDEGYGLNSPALCQLAADGARVVVSVDCGVTAVEPARAASEVGVDLIITDHHNPPATLESLPPAYAVVHPRRPDSAYPFGDLCGAGVAYKLAWRMATLHCGSDRVNPALRSLLVELLAFAALGVVADVVPLLGENRVIARFGLARIKHSPLTGLRALVEASGLSGDRIDADHVGFVLGPRLNACGRLGHAREAVDLFTTAGPEEAASIAASLTRLNNERRETEREIVEQAVEAAEAAGMTGTDRRAIVLADERWHQGVVGIACSRLVDLFHRPTILLSQRDGECHGSGRSIHGYSLHEALTRCAHLLGGYGGHDMAAGVKLPAAGLEAFANAFIADANQHLTAEHLKASLWLDTEASIDELTPDAVASLDRMAPFGQGNPRPRVLIRGARIMSRPETMGRGGRHLALRVGQEGRWLRLVGWGWGEHAETLAQGQALDAVVTPKLSTWNGRTTVQAEIHDLRAR